MQRATSRRVLVADHQRSFAEAVGQAIERFDGLELVGVALDGATCRSLLAQHAVDVVVLDVHLPDVEGLDLAAQLVRERPACDVVVLTADPVPGLLTRAVDAGVAGFLRKDQPLDDILDAIADPSAVSPSLAQQVRDETAARREGRPEITDREQTVLELLGEGVAPKQIARRLGITVHTARGHVKALLAKLGCHSALEAVLTAQRLGLLAGQEDLGEQAGPPSLGSAT